MSALGDQNRLFATDELKGDQWSIKGKLLERRRRFKVPPEIWSETQVLILPRNNLIHDNGQTSTLSSKEQGFACEAAWNPQLNDSEIVVECNCVRHALKGTKSLVQFVEAWLEEDIT